MEEEMSAEECQFALTFLSGSLKLCPEGLPTPMRAVADSAGTDFSAPGPAAPSGVSPMREGHQRLVYQGAGRRAPAVAGGVSQFAAEVVARLAAREVMVDAAVREGCFERFMSAVRSSDPSAFEALKPELRRARVTPAILADQFIPRAARLLGQMWDEDCLSFAEVTIGTARLQAILREVGAGWAADDGAGGRSQTMLILLPEGEQHTLGALVVMNRLRREGVSVCLRIAPPPADLRDLVSERGFDGVIISVGGKDKLDAARDLVKILRTAARAPLRVAIGGAVLAEPIDVVAHTGADVATNDIDAALAAFGMAGLETGAQAQT